MTVGELIDLLALVAPDRAVSVCLQVGSEETEDFTVELSDDGWIVLEG